MKKVFILILVYLFSYSAWSGNFHKAVKENDIKTVLEFVNAGVDVDLQDKDGKTPLHWASSLGNIRIVSLLIKNGAKVNTKNEYGMTPLHWASLSGNTEIVSLLIKNGAKVNAKDKGGMNPLYKALVKGNTETGGQMQFLDTALIAFLVFCAFFIIFFIRYSSNVLMKKFSEEIRNSVTPKFIETSVETKSLVDLAVDVWRLESRITKESDKLGEDSLKAIQASLAKITRYLDTHDIETNDITGQPYNEGLNVEVIDWLNEEGSIEKAKIIETIQPSILSRGQLIKKAVVKVEKG